MNIARPQLHRGEQRGTAAPGLPLISVVVPSYNQGHFLPQTLESIFRQGYPRLEVVVIDGGSADDSVGVIRRYEPRLKFWRSERDGGQSAAINEGMRCCSGDLVAWLNSDDYYWDDCLWTVGKAYARYPGRGLYVGNGLRYDQRTGVHVPFNPRHVAMNRESLTRGADFVLQPSTFFLREAWRRVGGLDESLRFCMDWDVFLRITALYPCVVINEFLGVSREYEETKTRSGKMERAFEIVRMIRRHTDQETTPGSLLYLLETLAGLGRDEGVTPAIAAHLTASLQEVIAGLAEKYGRGLGFPAQTDPQDDVYLPLPCPGVGPVTAGDVSLPSISVVVTGKGNDDYLERTLRSVRDQEYPSAEVVTAGRGAAGAADGMRRARGEVLVWAEAGDLLADGSLRSAGAAFAADPSLDLLCGNALHVDENDELFLADHRTYDSAFWIGKLPTAEPEPYFHFEPYRAPRPAVYFRRRLLARCGGPDPKVRHGFADAELFRRLAGVAGRALKLERTLALCRESAADYGTRRRRMLGDFFRVERSSWPRPWRPGYGRLLRRFIGNFTRWKFPGESRRAIYWVAACTAALSAITGVGNPMYWWPGRDKVPPRVTFRPRPADEEDEVPAAAA